MKDFLLYIKGMWSALAHSVQQYQELRQKNKSTYL